MSKGLKIMNAVASAMRQSSPSQVENPKHHSALAPEAVGDPSEGHADPSAAPPHSGGEKFGVDELEGKICKDCHDKVKQVLGGGHGGTRGEHNA